MSLVRWLMGLPRNYIGNATSVRDFRVQMRGSRSVLLFGLYLGVLILIGMFTYSQTAGQETMSVVDAQRQLTNLYSLIMMMLATMILLVAPALTATSVVMERQRKSLDLIFSAPVSPKYFLVGKMIGSYRFTWMLLILSLPVTATCVVLGGASWSDVLTGYVLLSMHALLITSFGLLMSTMTQRPASAILWTYSATGFYAIYASVLGFGMSMLGGGGSREASFVVALSPYTVAVAPNTYTMIMGYEVPNWIIASVVILATTRLIVLAAGALLAPYAGKEIASLRINGLLCLMVWAGYLASIWAPAGRAFTAGGGSTNQSVMMGIYQFWLVMGLMILMPFFACFGYDGERRYRPNGVFSVRAIFDGTPRGALPYTLAIILGTSLASLLGAYLSNGFVPDANYFVYVLFTVAFWTFFWAIGRFTSSMFLGLRQARTLQFAAFLVLVVIPVPIMSMVSSAQNEMPMTSAIWELHILRPLFDNTTDRVLHALIAAIILLLVCIPVLRIAERRTKEWIAFKGASYEGTYSTA